jgi:hypothetical protein
MKAYEHSLIGPSLAYCRMHRIQVERPPFSARRLAGNPILDRDTDGLGKGSRMHDLATVAADAILQGGDQGALDRLFDYAARNARPGEFEISLAACLLTLLALRIERDGDGAGLVQRVTDTVEHLNLTGAISRGR